MILVLSILPKCCKEQRTWRQAVVYYSAPINIHIYICSNLPLDISDIIFIYVSPLIDYKELPLAEHCFTQHNIHAVSLLATTSIFPPDYPFLPPSFSDWCHSLYNCHYDTSESSVPYIHSWNRLNIWQGSCHNLVNGFCPVATVMLIIHLLVWWIPSPAFGTYCSYLWWATSLETFLGIIRE